MRGCCRRVHGCCCLSFPAEKLPTEAGKVTIRAELSKPVNKPGFQEVTHAFVGRLGSRHGKRRASASDCSTR